MLRFDGFSDILHGHFGVGREAGVGQLIDALATNRFLGRGFGDAQFHL